MFFLTPSYAANALTFHDSLAQVMSKADTSDNPLPESFDTLVAVVDRLPQPSHTPYPFVAKNAKYRTGHPPINDVGSEGLAFAITTATPEAQDGAEMLSSTNTDYDRRSPIASANKLGTVKIQLDPSIKPRKVSLSKAGEDTVDRSYHGYSIQIPLVNTVFHNGLPTTLLHDRYSIDASSGLRTRIWARKLQHHTFSVPIRPPADRMILASVSLPLVPLTLARPVAACMGNIIRLLRLDNGVDENSAETILASQELEKAVSAYLAARNMPPQTVTVWAFVTPGPTSDTSRGIFAKKYFQYSRLTPPETFWKDGASAWLGHSVDDLEARLRNGAKFCRIMSGGGGWGKKAGLLSLDPDTNYDSTTTLEEPSFFDSLGLDSEHSSPLNEVARVGDYVQFFIVPPTDNRLYTDGEQTARQHRQDHWHSFDFGVIPSTVDTLRADEISSSNENASPVLRVYRNHFGALSEGGMAVETHEYKRQEPDVCLKSTQSKIDAPFSRFGFSDSRSYKQTRGKASDKVESSERFDPDSSDNVDRYFESAEASDLESNLRALDAESNRILGDVNKSVDSENQKSALFLNMKPIEPRNSDGKVGFSTAVDRSQPVNTMAPHKKRGEGTIVEEVTDVPKPDVRRAQRTIRITKHFTIQGFSPMREIMRREFNGQPLAKVLERTGPLPDASELDRDGAGLLSHKSTFKPELGGTDAVSHIRSPVSNGHAPITRNEKKLRTFRELPNRQELNPTKLGTPSFRRYPTNKPLIRNVAIDRNHESGRKFALQTKLQMRRRLLRNESKDNQEAQISEPQDGKENRHYRLSPVRVKPRVVVSSGPRFHYHSVQPPAYWNEKPRRSPEIERERMRSRLELRKRRFEENKERIEEAGLRRRMGGSRDNSGGTDRELEESVVALMSGR